MPIPLAVYVDVNSHGRFEIHNKVHNKFTVQRNEIEADIQSIETIQLRQSANQCFNESVYQSRSPK